MHREFDGSQRLFQIGLKPLDPADWIDADDRLAADLAEKRRLMALHPDRVFAAEPESMAAQGEVLDLLGEHLPQRFPEVYRRQDDAITVVADGTAVELGADTPPLQRAGLLVQEDLVLMHRDESGWRLTAASLSFPSSWSLREKFGRPMDEVHAPVPGFGAGTRNAELIARMFDNLRASIAVVRWNFSFYGDNRLHHPQSATPEARQFDAGLFLRVERQTLRRLPQSADILFTIRIYLDPVEALARQPDGAALASRLIAQVEALTPEQAAYKGLATARPDLLRRLRGVAGGAA